MYTHIPYIELGERRNSEVHDPTSTCFHLAKERLAKAIQSESYAHSDIKQDTMTLHYFLFKDVEHFIDNSTASTLKEHLSMHIYTLLKRGDKATKYERPPLDG